MVLNTCARIRTVSRAPDLLLHLTAFARKGSEPSTHSLHGEEAPFRNLTILSTQSVIIDFTEEKANKDCLDSLAARYLMLSPFFPLVPVENKAPRLFFFVILHKEQYYKNLQVTTFVFPAYMRAISRSTHRDYYCSSP